MTQDWQSLEREIDAELAGWGGRLDVNMRPQLLTGVREQVQLLADEQWLAAQTDPQPRPELLRQVRARVAGEAGSLGSSVRRQRSLSACAAAVFVLVCFGLIRFSANSPGNSPTLVDDRIAASIAAAAERALEAYDPVISAEIDVVSQQIETFEQRIANMDQLGETQRQMLDSLRQDIDELLESTGTVPLSQAMRSPRVFG